MNHEDGNELDPIARLRASDPAAGIEPREGFADDVVSQMLETSSSAAAGQAAPVVELGAERARRRPKWIPLVAVAASLAIVGGAGFGIGASTGVPAVTADGAAPPISLHSGENSSGAAPQTDAAQGRSGGPLSASKYGMTEWVYPYGLGRNAFSSSGLSTAASTAAAYSYDARAASNTESVARLAATLGVNGTPELSFGIWGVGPQGGTASNLNVSLDGPMSFYFTDQRLDPWACFKDPAEAGSCEQPVIDPSDLPSADDAISVLRMLIDAVGRDADEFEYSSQPPWEGAFTRNAQAWPVIDGQRLDQPWTLELTEGGAYSFVGALADVISLGDYAIISEQEAFERLSDPRFGAQMRAYQMADEIADGEEIADPWVPSTEPPATPSSGSALAWPVNDIEIVGARLGLASEWQPDGSVIIVPAYEFTDADGGIWSMIAVTDDKLNFDVE